MSYHHRKQQDGRMQADSSTSYTHGQGYPNLDRSQSHSRAMVERQGSSASVQGQSAHQPNGFGYPQQHEHQHAVPGQQFSGMYNLSDPQNQLNLQPSFHVAGPDHISNFIGAQEQNEADLNTLLATYQPRVSETGLGGNYMPDTNNLGLAPVMGSGTSHPQLDPATAAAAAAAYGTLGRAVVAAPGSQQMDGNISFQPQQGPSDTSSIDAATHGWAHSTGSFKQMARGSNSQTAQSKKRGSDNAHAPGTNLGAGYEGDGSNSASTQTPAQSSSGEEQADSIKAPFQQQQNSYNSVQFLPEYLRSSSSFSVSSAGGVGQPIEARRDGPTPLPPRQPPMNRNRRSQSGSFGTGSPSGYAANSSKRLSGPAITTSGTTNNPRASHHSANQTDFQGLGKSIISGHAASHPPGTGAQVLRGSDNHASGSNAASDFTRRKGWHTRIVDELLDFVHALDRSGKILYAASSVGAISGWKTNELIGCNVRELIHPDDAQNFFDELEAAFKDRAELTVYYRFRKKPQTAADKQKVREQRAAIETVRQESTPEGDSSNPGSNGKAISPKFTDIDETTNNIGGDDDELDIMDDSVDKYVIMEVSGHPYFWQEGAEEAGTFGMSNLAEPIDDASQSEETSPRNAQSEKGKEAKSSKTGQDKESQKKVECFFCTGRVYPTKTVGMLDSFLELKLENEKLRLQLGEMSLQDGSTDHAGGSSSDGRRSLEEVGYHPDYAIIDAARPNRKSLDGNNATYGSFDAFDPQSNVGFAPQKQSAVTAPGLQSTPTSPLTTNVERAGTGAAPNGNIDGGESDDATSPAGDDDDDASKRKKKKSKPEEGDYVCTDCGRVDSPEWRKGPLGPKTLCNACGLRWAKKVKRSGADPNALNVKDLSATDGGKLKPAFTEMMRQGSFQESSPQNMPLHGGVQQQVSGAPGFAMARGGQEGLLNQHSMQHQPHPQSLFGVMSDFYDGNGMGSFDSHVMGPGPAHHNSMEGMISSMTSGDGNFAGPHPMNNGMMHPPSHPQPNQQGHHHAMRGMYGGGM